TESWVRNVNVLAGRLDNAPADYSEDEREQKGVRVHQAVLSSMLPSASTKLPLGLPRERRHHRGADAYPRIPPQNRSSLSNFLRGPSAKVIGPRHYEAPKFANCCHRRCHEAILVDLLLRQSGLSA